jgi:hypothetical protein
LLKARDMVKAPSATRTVFEKSAPAMVYGTDQNGEMDHSVI